MDLLEVNLDVMANNGVFAEASKFQAANSDGGR